MTVSRSFWKNKRVFLTGHTGFKGGWLSLWLGKMGAEVAGYSLEPPTRPSLFDCAQLASHMKSIVGDVRDLASLSSEMSAFKPEIVIHMAAQSLVRLSYRDPVGTYSTNVMGTVHVLESARKTPSVRSVLVVTSDKCYENREWVWGYRENDPMGGHDPYSNSKGCAELVTSAYRKSFYTGPAALASGRAGNVIGGGDWAEDRLIPDCIRAMSSGKPAVIRNPHSIRPWQHVLEPLSGYIELIERLWREPEKFGGGWNFGPDLSDAQPVHWIADRMVARWGGKASWQLHPESATQPHEANYLKLDCSQANAELGWRPALKLEDALDWVVEWYRRQSAGEDARKISLEQIARYEGLRSAENGSAGK